MLTFFQIYCYAINALAIFWNGVLLVLSAHKSIETIQELRYFLSNVSSAGMVFSLCILLLQPQMVCRGTMTIRVPLGPANLLGDYHCKLLASIAVTFYLYGMLSFPLFFVYRTMILINSTSYGQYFNKKNLLFTFFIIFIGSCVEGAFFYYSSIPYNVGHVFLPKRALQDLFDRLNRTTNVLATFDDPHPSQIQHQVHITSTAATFVNVSGGAYGEDTVKRMIPLFGDDYVRNPLIMYCHGISLFAHVIAYTVILISAHFMLKTLKQKQGTMSRDTLLANEVLVHAVFAEAFLPLLLAAPVAANAGLTFFYENSLQWQEYLPAYCLSMVPLLSPLTSIAFIKPYRQTMKYAVTLGFLRQKPVQRAEQNDT